MKNCVVSELSIAFFFNPAAAVQRGTLGLAAERRRPIALSEASAGVPPYSFVVPSLCHMNSALSMTSPRLVFTNLGKSNSQNTVKMTHVLNLSFCSWSLYSSFIRQKLTVNINLSIGASK
jgi:hypothetical protein